MEIKLCVVFAALVTGTVCSHIQGHIRFEKSTALSGLTCSAAEQIGDVIPSQTTVMCMSECARTEGCRTVFYTNPSFARCRSRYKEATDLRLSPMPGSVSYKTVVDCKSGWLLLGDSCYLFNPSTNLQFDQAQDYCRSLGSHVLHIGNEAENYAIANVLNEKGMSSNVWIDVRFNVDDGSWYSSSSTLITFLGLD